MEREPLIPCSECLVLCDVALLENCADIAPLAGDCCPVCAARLLTDYFDDGVDRSPNWVPARVER
jgi:hypothetical protein